MGALAVKNFAENSPSYFSLIGREKFEDKQGAGHDVQLNYVEQLYYSADYLRQFAISSRLLHISPALRGGRE